jgi:hypothetical protein
LELPIEQCHPRFLAQITTGLAASHLGLLEKDCFRCAVTRPGISIILHFHHPVFWVCRKNLFTPFQFCGTFYLGLLTPSTLVVAMFNYLLLFTLRYCWAL